MYSFKQSKLLSAVVILTISFECFGEGEPGQLIAPRDEKQAGRQSRIGTQLKTCQDLSSDYAKLKAKIPEGCFDLIDKCISNLDTTEAGMAEGLIQAIGYSFAQQSILPTTATNNKVNCEYTSKDYQAQEDKLTTESKSNSKAKTDLDKDDITNKKEYQDALKAIEDSEVKLVKELKEIRDKEDEQNREASLESAKMLNEYTKKERQLTEELSLAKRKFLVESNIKSTMLANYSLEKISRLCSQKTDLELAEICNKNPNYRACKKYTYGNLNSASATGGNTLALKRTAFDDCVKNQTLQAMNTINEKAEELKYLQVKLISIGEEIDNTKKLQDAQMDNLRNSMAHLKTSNEEKYKIANQEFQQLAQQRQRLDQMNSQKNMNMIMQRLDQGRYMYETAAKKARLGVPAQSCSPLSVNEASTTLMEVIQKKKQAKAQCCNITYEEDGKQIPYLNNVSEICSEDIKKDIKNSSDELKKILDGKSSSK